MFINSDFYKLTRSFGTNPANEVVKDWLQKLCRRLEVAIICTRRIQTLLVNRANHLRKTVRSLKHGRNQRKFLAKDWDFCVYQDELSIVVVQKENFTLKQDLAASVEECESVRKTNAQLKAQIQVASERLKHFGDTRMPLEDGGTHTSREYSKSHKRCLKRKRVQECELSLAWLERQGYKATKVEAINKATGEIEVITLSPTDSTDILGSDSVSDSDIDMINMILFIKDRYNVSGNAYHEMTKVCKSLPRSYKIKQRIAELNRRWNIRPTPDGTGVQQPLEERLNARVSRLINVSPLDAPFQVQKKIRVKLSGDGTNIRRQTFACCKLYVYCPR